MQSSTQYPSYPTAYPLGLSNDTHVVPIPTASALPTYYPPVVNTVPIDTSGMEIRLRELWVQLERAKKKYHKYVSVAATTPTYFWIPVAGTISAPVIAGVYGDRANKKKKLIERLQSEISVLQYQIAQARNQQTAA
jgi:hypothetical protein